MRRAPGVRVLTVKCWMMFSLVVVWLTPFLLPAQTPPVLPPGGLIQLQVAQPAVDTSTPVTATAEFDPPVIGIGQKAFYRVSVDATESSIQLPEKIPAAGALKMNLRTSGQITQMQINRFRPLTTFLYEVQCPEQGNFTITNFTVDVSGASVTVPAANLTVVGTNSNTAASRQLRLEASETNVFLGEPFHVRVILPPGPGNTIEALREIEFHGDGLMTDKTATQQAIEPVDINGQLETALICEMTITPIAAGPLKFSAQGFTAGREFTAPLSIHSQVTLPGGLPKYTLLVSDPVQIMARPLPMDGQLPGFTGAIGKFFMDPPHLTTNRLNVGEPVQLKLTFHGEGDLSRFVAPEAPLSRDWQIIADPPPATSFTLIPLADDIQQTPAIPFSYFDPVTARYVDLTVPPIPITVIGTGLPSELPVVNEAGQSQAPIRLSAMASTPGKAVSNLKPLQLSFWFAGLQLIPAAGFIVLWQWDRRRRYLEAHPEIVRRAQARRALRRERSLLLKAYSAGDGTAFVQHAAQAMCVAVAPHFPANPRALVSGDVLEQLEVVGQNGLLTETVRDVFAAADAQFAVTPQNQPDLLALRPGVENILQKLEERL